MKRKNRFVGFVGDWRVGKDSLILKILGQDIPDPKLEQDHPFVQCGRTSDIPNLKVDPGYNLTFRIIPGKYCNRLRDEIFFDYIRPGDYDFDALVFCFALDCSASFYRLERYWIPRAKTGMGHRMPYYMVVGTKCDLPVEAVTEDQEQDLKDSTEHAYYSRSSALNNINIERIRNMLLNLLSYQRRDD